MKNTDDIEILIYCFYVFCCYYGMINHNNIILLYIIILYHYYVLFRWFAGVLFANWNTTVGEQNGFARIERQIQHNSNVVVQFDRITVWSSVIWKEKKIHEKNPIII